MRNSIGMNLVSIPAGSFDMGVDSAPLPDELIRGAPGVTYDRLSNDGDYDEAPVRRVAISRPFLISQTEVTIEQFRLFRPGYEGHPHWAPAASGVSWDDAVAFCAWLSEREGKPYRLPTEAEWEYACRAGTRTPFSSGLASPGPGEANAWGVMNLHLGVPEWCLDWHGRYPRAAQTDPAGPAHGEAKVIRGGGLDYRPSPPQHDTGAKMPAELPYFRRSANRASLPPCFGSPGGNVGFRVVQDLMPTTAPTSAEAREFVTGVRENARDLARGPDLATPFYRVRPMFPDLGEHDFRAVGWKIGLPPGLGGKWHNTAVAVCDNGDLVAAYYNTTKWEDDPEQSLLTMRLRRGAADWDFPEPWPDFADSAVAAPVFWNDGRGTLWLFFGSPRLLGGPPFWFMTSRDSGATWGPVRMPKLVGPVGPFTAQPVNSVVRDADGTIHLAVDGAGSTTALFASDDDGATWRDAGGRTMGRHTSFVLGIDGRELVGYGGKNSHLDGFMPVSTSRDGGRTYEHAPTPFMPLASGQRPSVIRLASGRLFFVADTLSSKVPGGRSASFVATSDDDGATWTCRDLPIASTVGYVTATQAPNGVIHIVTSKTKPVPVHIELNEAWVLHGGPASAVDDPAAGELLDGLQQARFPDGSPNWECTFAAGRKKGTETFWNPDGTVRWRKLHADGGAWTWQFFDGRADPVAESRWEGKRLVSYWLG